MAPIISVSPTPLGINWDLVGVGLGGLGTKDFCPGLSSALTVQRFLS